MNQAQSLLKFLKSRGGYPNPRIETFLELFELTPQIFIIELKDLLGEEKLIEFIKKNLVKSQNKDGYLRLYPYKKFGDKESFVDLKFDDATIELADMDEPNYAAVVVDNWELGDSKIKVDTTDEGLVEYDLDGLLDAIWEDDPYQHSDAVDEWMSALRALSSESLGLPLFLGERKIK